VEPKAIEAEAGEYFQIDNFAVERDSLFAPVSATFTIGYSHNAGEVEVSWDFDGDGQYDQTGIERSVSYVYAKPGFYFPSVRVKDNGTGKILTMPLVSVAMIVSLENVYVDALADNGGDGSKEKPFRTIREGVAVCGENGIVHVKGGDDRVYNIVTADDLVQFNFSNVLLTQEDGFGRVKVDIDPSLNANTNNPSVFTIAEDVNHVTITGFDFTYYGNDNGEYAGQSLGNKGRVIDVYGDYATVSNCVFVQEGKMKSPSRGEVGHCAVATRATKDVVDTREKYGLYLKVIDCRFEGRTPGYDMTTIMCGKDTEIINNVFTNCYWMYYPVKQLTSDFTFVSNRMVNCRSMYSNSGGYNELPNAEIAYNTFITEFGEPFLTKEYDGLHENVFIHHNTVVGSTNFVRVARNVRSPWRPKIYDNLIVLSAGSALFQEDETEFYKKDGIVSASSSFKTDGGAAFTNNVYMADNFVAGKALSLEGYDLSKGLKVENNTVLSAAPRFMSTDMNSPDFMRLKAKKGDYPFSAATGGYPNYVGAQEPMLRSDGMRIIIR
jgi:PKD repeat protein